MCPCQRVSSTQHGEMSVRCFTGTVVLVKQVSSEPAMRVRRRQEVDLAPMNVFDLLRQRRQSARLNSLFDRSRSIMSAHQGVIDIAAQER